MDGFEFICVVQCVEGGWRDRFGMKNECGFVFLLCGCWWDVCMCVWQTNAQYTTVCAHKCAYTVRVRKCVPVCVLRYAGSSTCVSATTRVNSHRTRFTRTWELTRQQFKGSTSYVIRDMKPGPALPYPHQFSLEC